MIGYITLALVAVGTVATLYQMYKNRRRLVFKIRESYQNDKMLVSITIVNRLGRPVEIGPIQAEVAADSFIVFPDLPQLRGALQDGIGYTFRIEITCLGDGDVKYFVVTDKEGKHYKGKVPKIIRKMIRNWDRSRR